MTDSSSDLRPRLNLDSFIRTVEKSGLVDAERARGLRDELPEEAARDARSAARYLIEQKLITDWQARKLLRGKHKGFSLGKYQLLRLLGKGGMSSVYLAEHMLMRRRCALKVLPIGKVDDTSWLARFHREAQAIAALDHPNIVRAYDVDHEQDGERNIHFLVMEFVDGRSLQEVVTEDGPLELEVAADYFRQAALGLEHAHRAGLVHRDVKPGNLLVDRQGVVKVLDLGLARFSEVSDDNPLTVAHDERVLGTADYLSPEQAIDSHTVDARADVYSLGCTIFFALTGRPPFTGGSLAQRLMAHQLKEAPPVAEFRPDINESEKGRALAEIIRRMMIRDRDERPQTMAEVADLLENWLHPPGDSAPSIPVATPVASPPTAVPVAQPVMMPVDTGAGSSDSRSDDPAAASPFPPAAPPDSLSAATGPSPDTRFLPPAGVPPESPVPPAPLEASVPESSDQAVLPGGAVAAGADPALIPQPGQAEGELPSILGGTPTGFLAPGAPRDAQDFSQTETFVPQTPATGTPHASPLPESPPSDGFEMPAADGAGTVAEPFPPQQHSGDGPAELDQTVITSGEHGGPAMPAPAEASAGPVFPVEPSFAPAPVTAPAAPANSLSGSVPAPPAATVTSRRKSPPIGRPVVIISAVVLLIVCGGGVWFMQSGSADRSSRSETSGTTAGAAGTGTASAGSRSAAAPGPLKTRLSVGPGREYSTIAAALDYVKTNRDRYPDTTRRSVVRIEVAGSETFEESIVIDNSSQAWPSGIQITSTNEFPFVLKPSGSGPAVRLVSIQNLQLDRVQIDVSGSDVGIELESFLNRTTLSRLEISGFRQTGILGRGVAGVQRDEVVIEHVDLRPGDAGATGMHLTGGDASTARISIRDCRLFGRQSAGIMLDSGAIGLDIRRTIIDQADVGVSFAGGPQEWRDVRIVNCTFHEISRAAIRFSDMPAVGSSGMEFRRNLFARGQGPELKVVSDYNDQAFDSFLSTQFGSVDNNWTDRGQPADPASGERDLIARDERRVPEIQFLTVDREDDDFLTPQRGTPYASVGVRPGDDGDPYIGARPQPE